MDERHWWIAGKIQETFKIGGYDNPTLLEDFMCEEPTLAKINRFLKSGGPCRLFFYSQKPENGVLSARELHVTGSLASLKDVDLDNVNILYFLRNVVEKDVDATHMERDIFCGELKHNTIETLTTLLSDIYIPLIKAQKEWGECNQEGQAGLTYSMDKFLTALNESTASMQSSKQLMLKQPENIVLNDFKQQRAAALDPQLIGQYEELVIQWMNTIEAILVDTSDERFMDPNAGPLSELERWRRRQRLLTSITEQLKGKECKAVIGVLITAKSRFLKRWKTVDAGITDAMNDTKDKVKYLESLRRHFDQLYSDATPSSIINNAITGIASGVRQMDSISRYYARTGFLGLVFTKVTNQLVLACKEYLKESTLTFDDVDELWEKIGQEIQHRDMLPSADPQHRMLRNHVEAKFKGSRAVKSKEGGDLGIQDDTLYGRLKACLTLQVFYRETLRSLRDSLGQSQNLSHYSSLSSVVAIAGGLSSRSKQGNVQSRLSSQNSVSPKKGMSTLLSDNVGHGVSIADEDAILSHMDTFCERIRQLMDVINTLALYNKMVQTAAGIPRPRKEDLTPEEPEEEKYPGQKHGKKIVGFQEPEESKVAVKFNVQCPSPDRGLGAIAEDAEETAEGHTLELELQKDEKNFDPSSEQADEAYDVVTTHTGLSEDELACLRKYFSLENNEEAPSISGIIADHLQRMTKSMSESVTTKTMLDVESKDKDRFLEHYDKFQAISLELEKFLTAYLHAIFMRKMKTQQGLDIITRFAPVQNIHGIRNTVSEKFVEIFNWYESDLEDVHVLYEANKNAPQLVRNAPPVAGAIHWARQLLKRIEDPMKVFRDNKAVNQLGDFGRIVRIYNRLATALVTFESLWFAQWKNRIDQARNGLRATLFVHHPVTNKIVVNADERVLELIHEAKWLTRLDIQIPETAVAIMQQESRFKSYKSHLQLVLTDYQLVCESIPAPLRGLFTSHMEFVELQLQPGLSTLAWNSMNIDAFLHQIHVATKRLKDLGEKVSHIMETKVFDTIEKIRSFYLFDYERAFSKSWPPEEFQQSMVKSVRERAVTLQNYVETIMDGLQSVASTLVFRKNETMTKSKKIALMMSEDDMQREKQRVVREEHHVAELITFYRDQVYAAVLSATCMSLVTLAESAGCEGELVRSISQMSARSGDSGASPVPGRRSPGSRAGSASSTGYPHSSLSALSTMTWTTEKTQEATYLQFEVEVKFSIPVIIVEPTLDISQTAVTQVAKAILDANKNVCWSGPGGRENFYDSVSADSIVLQLMSQLATVVEDLDSVVGKHLYHFSYYNFLWKDDMHGNFKEFISAEPGTPHIKKEVERFLDIEKKVLSIPSILPVGPICLHTDPIKDALHGFAMAWKTQFAMVLHEEAKRKLDTAVLYRSNVRNRLELHVQSLDQLNSALHLLEELRDMENKIDGIYLPIENMYAKLREFELRLPRNEVEEVDQLRDKWQELVELSEQVRVVLLNERRGAFEQELDKQVKTFVVEVIQFRNAFDAQGPSVPGIPPAEAVTRLQDFQQRYLVYDAKRNTLDSVSKLFGIVCKPFPELDRTGEELDLLSQLYGLFQKFIRFDNRFRDTLWAEVDLDTSFREVEAYWDECLALPSKLKDWDAYNDLKTKVQTYLEVFPLLNNLASKEIRNRHWLQVMQVTGSSFQLEANVFKLSHLLDIGLIKHRSEIEDICRGAGRELELEIKMRMTEEEWTEQVLSFEHYKRRGPVYLDKVFTERLLEQLEDAQALLANMLTSRYIGPLRDEAASWAEKLKEVAEVLELWLEVQDLWQYLEAVFSNSYAAKELPQEAKRFVRIDKGWAKMMKRAFDTRNVLQCCYGGEVPKAVVLRHIHEELEICFKSLVGYLDNKRRAFPRFYFVSDPVLLAMLSKPNDLESVRPHFRSIFSSLHDVQLKQTEVQKDEESSRDTPSMGSVTPGKKSSPTGLSETPSKVDKRLNEVYDKSGENDKDKQDKSRKARNNRSRSRASFRSEQNFQASIIYRDLFFSKAPMNTFSVNTNPSSITHGMSYLPSEGIVEDIVVMDAVSVSSVDGERLELQDKVTLTDGVEVWLQKLQDSISRSLSSMNTGIIQDYNSGVAMDEWPLKYPAQVCRIGMLYQWTRECEQGISEIKYDRKALQGTLKKYTATIAKLPTCLSKGAWRTLDDPMLPRHKARLECMITQSLYLRDILENLYNRKLREPTDFEWRRSIRCYFQSHEEKMMPLIWILDNHYMYGNEFYGTNAGVALTPLTERCFLTMSQALFHFQGSCVTGPVGVGKTEVVKGLGNILGHFLAMFQCSQQSDPVSIGRLVQGAAMDGCWCVLDEGHSLCKEAMSVLLDHINSVLTALKTRNYFTTLADGQEVCVKRAFSMHMTVNPAASPPNQDLPSDLKAYFRTVNLVKPDLGLILKAKCASMSFKAPFVLGARLKVLTEIARDQLPSMTHHHFSITSLTAVLRRAMQKRKLIKEEKSQDRNDSKMKDETSRSESQASDKQLILPSLNTSSSLKMTTGSQRKMATPNPMSQWGKLEHALVCKTLEEVIGPRLTTENMLIFKNILRDIFAGLPDVPVTAQAHSAKSRGLDIEVALEHKALDKNLIPNKTWLQKCIQLYNISQVHHGVIVAGPPGSGKTTCIQTLVEALCTTPRGMSRQSQSSRASNMAETSHKLIRINPLVVNDSALMFGYLNNSHDWVDGIFTSACRKANRNLSTTWLCLDGPINPGWADNFNSILAEDKVLHLKNGDKMFLSDKIIVIFETDNLSDASPTTVSKSGIVFLDKDVVGWKPIAKAWLDSRSPQEIHEQVLQRSFQKTLDPLINFVLNEARCPLKLSEVGLFSTCLGLLSAMLADNIEIGGELHIERLFLFCLIWTFGGLLDGVDRRGFSDLLKTLSSALPDDDRDICVFDYYVDESGEWDPWISRVPEAVYGDSQDMLGEIFVDTVDTIRTRILMDFAAASGLNVLLVGTPGCGKTTQIGDFMDAQDQQVNVCKRLVFSGASTAEQLQQFVEANIYLRQGYVYGARDNKKLKVFIDDVNLPVPDEYGVQRNNELLRQLLDDKVLCTLQKPFEWKTIEGLTVACAMSMSDHPSVNNQLISERLLRHFAVFNLPAPQDAALKSIVHGILEANVTDNEKPGLEIDLHNHIVRASCDLLSALQDVLRPTPMPGRYHYLFTLKDITQCFQCMKRLPDESMADEHMVVSLWKHEITRIIRDRISRTSDLIWFDETLGKTIAENWPKLGTAPLEHFVTFPTDNRQYQRPLTSTGAKHIKIVLQPVKMLRDLHSCLNTHLTRYNEEFGNVRLNVMLSDFIISHIVRMHRVLSFHHGGNLLLIGAVGSHLATLCKLALHVADVPIHKVDTSKCSNFFDGLRSAVRLSGSEGKILTVMFTGRDLEDPVYLDAINSLLISGQYTHLFSNDELEGLLQALGPGMKREFPSMSIDPMKFFVARVKTNLHILICLQPGHQLLRIASSQYPGLLSGCAIQWMCDWPQESLIGEASYFITRYQLTEEFEDLTENVTTCLANIHSYVMQDCRQLPWAGDLNPKVTLNIVKAQEKKKEQIKIQSAELPNLPYSKTILQERIRRKHKPDGLKAKNEVFVGPTTFKRFMDCFKYLYTMKARERTQKVEQLKRVLVTLDQTRTDAKVMKKAIKTVTTKFEDAKETTADLLNQLTLKATVLEKLKAKVGLSTSLDAYLHLNEMEAVEEEEDELLHQEEYDDYDKEFDKMREATLKTRQVQAKEELSQAQKNVEECRQQLNHAREQVLYWRSKVDRQCIERMKVFTNPPVLVLQVIEMVMMLIGKRLPSQRIHDSREYPGKDDMSSRMSSSSSSTKILIKKAKPKDGIDKVQWKAMQMTLNDATKFVDMLHNVSWEDGLPDDVLRAVESYLATGRDGELGVTGEGTLLENATDMSFKAVKRSPSPDNAKGITIAAAKYSSEDCATLVQYTIAIVEYTRRCGPLKVSMERLHELEREIEENERLQKELEEEPKEEVEEKIQEPDIIYTEDDLPMIQGEVNDLQEQFDQSVMEKHSLQMELHSMIERLKAATEMIESLKCRESKWRLYVKENDSNELLLANCITTAGFLTYCGPTNIDTRKRMAEFCLQVCEHHGLPMPKSLVFKNMELIHFLYTELDIIQLEILRLPTTNLMLDNACFLMQDESTTAWPLICDPTSRVIDWLHTSKKEMGLVEVKYSEMRSQLENCLSDGSPLLVTDCDVTELVKDKRFSNAIRNCSSFITGKTRFKIIVEDHEVECDPHFRLFMHTTVEPHMVPEQLAAYTSVIFFQQYRKCVEDELLDRFMAHEKSRLEDERTALRNERKENLQFLQRLEQQMKDSLSSDIRLMNDLQATKKLAELKKQFDETVENQSRVEAAEASILKAREGFRSIAERAAVCFDTAQYLREISPLYQTAYHQFLSMYDAAISHSERSAVKAVIEKVTYSAYSTTARALLERDRQIYALLLALEVEDSHGSVGAGEREFLISPNYSTFVMAALGHNPMADSRPGQAKKPFDWMTDDQFHNLQILATHFEWFQEMFDRMPRDGRETQWRNLCETDQPEHVPLPDKMDDHYKPIQRLCVVRAVRPDRIMQASSLFINAVLGKKYWGELAIDLASLLKQSAPDVPLLLLFTSDTTTVMKLFTDFAHRKQNKILTLTLTDNSAATEKNARKHIHKAMAEGLWLLLHNAHNAPHMLNNLEAIFGEQTNVDPQFRLWVSAQTHPNNLPVTLLQNSAKAVIDTPKTMKDNLIRSFSLFEPDILRQSYRTEWPLMLHNLCYLHSAIQLRTRFGRGGWNCAADFFNIGQSELQEALAFMVAEFRDPLFCTTSDGVQMPRTTSWTGIRYMLAEVIYGSYMTDTYDHQSLAATVDYWISPQTIKKDFEVARLKYRHPAAFFNSNVRLNTLIQALDGIPNHFLEVPEGCHLHPNVETLLGDDQYVFTRLNKVLDAMPSSDTLVHQLFPRPPSPFDAAFEDKFPVLRESYEPQTGPALAGISQHSNNPLVVGQGVFSCASYCALKMRKEMELWEICHTSLSKVPRAYNKDYIIDRVKKIGGLTTFNNFIIRELETMYKLLTEIKSTLQVIKNACETTIFGDQVSEHVLSAADDLFYGRIPEAWSRMSGNSAPPLTWSLAQWLQELQNRCHHFEKILVQGRDKMPAYWLGAFFNPRGLLALLKQDCMRHFSGDKSGHFEQFVFQTEVTSRDKDHLRDPPQDGMFVHGIYIWGCAWEKTVGELQDAPPRSGYATLPVVHLTCVPCVEKTFVQDATKATETYQCPVYPSRIAMRDPILEMDLRREGISATRWALRGLSATIRPY